ncbi:MAG: hypothetical protein ACR2G7_12955 [Acidimicrobiales bacterium]
MSEYHSRPPAQAYTPTALPPVGARVLAFVAIIVAGICGGLIAYSITSLQCGSDDGRAASVLPAPPPGERPPAAPTDEPAPDDGCTTIAGLGGLLGAIVSATGVAIIAVLVLRAMSEWRRAPSLQRVRR